VRELTFSSSALRDLARIRNESEESWGAAQRDRYLSELNGRMGRLRERPESAPRYGSPRWESRRLVVGRHLVFFRFDEREVKIVRVLHQHMDVERHLGPELR